MPTRIRRTPIVIGRHDFAPEIGELELFSTGKATLVFHRAPDEGIRRPEDVVRLLHAKGIKTGILRAKNPTTHDFWWIPTVDLAKVGVPYAIALGAVIRAWLKQKKGRQIKLQRGSLKITANTPQELEQILVLLSRYDKEIGPLEVTKAEKESKKKTISKKKTRRGT